MRETVRKISSRRTAGSIFRKDRNEPLMRTLVPDEAFEEEKKAPTKEEEKGEEARLVESMRLGKSVLMRGSTLMNITKDRSSAYEDISSDVYSQNKNVRRKNSDHSIRSAAVYSSNTMRSHTSAMNED